MSNQGFRFYPEESGTLQPSLFKGDGEFIVRLPFGEDDIGNVFGVFCAFSPTPGGIDGQFDLVFNATKADRESGEITPLWDGLDTKAVLDRPDRRREVLNMICYCVDQLIGEAEPTLVSMCTYTPNLPDKALQKYETICGVFAANGYKAGRTDEFHGQQMWIMEKN